MSLLSSIVTSNDVQESEEYVAGGSKKIEVSGNHICKIVMAKEKESQNGAIGIDLQLENEEGKTIYDTVWVTNREKETYWIDKEGQKRELPGYAQICGLNFLLNGVWGLPESEPREIKEYDYNDRKEKHVTRNVVVSWISKPIGVCAQVTMEDSYRDKTKPITRVNAKHFYDPVSNLFSSEKKKGEEAAMKDKFAEITEATPVADKRELSKGVPTGGGDAVKKEELAF